MKKLDYDLIIVGLGPVGLFAANVFGKRGWKVLAIEQYKKRWPYPRAIGMDDETLRAIGSVGLQKQVQDQMHHLKGGHLLHGNNKVFYKADLISNNPLLGRQFLFYQPELEQLFEEGTQRYNQVELKYGYQLVDFIENSGDSVSATIKTESSTILNLNSRYLIGCDGANSFVRKKLEIQERSFNYDGYILKIDAEAKDLSKLKFDSNYFHKYCSAKKAWIHMVGRGNHCRWEFQFRDKIEDPKALSAESALQHIAETGADISNLSIINVAFYKYRSLVQKEWRKGSCFLAGDAAHLTPPYAGQGMCAGIRDIMNLSWKLEGLKQGQYSSPFLDTYKKERAPHIKGFIYIAIIIGYLFKTRFYYFILALSKLPFVKREDAKVYIPPPKLGKGIFGRHRLARRLVPYFKLLYKKDHKVIDECIDEKWALISAVKLDKKTLNDIQFVDIQAINISSNIEAHQWIKNWMNKKGVKHLLVRPDLYIFSAGTRVENILAEYNQVIKKHCKKPSKSIEKWDYQSSDIKQTTSPESTGEF